MKIIVTAIFLLGLLYLILPGPERIEQFSRLPDALKSQLAGDTVQNPNIAAYYSDYRRDFVTKFYFNDFRRLYCKQTFWGLPNPLCFIPPIRLNHPPERAFNYIRDQQESTYLEEYLYPLRESFFVNGYEPFDKNGRRFNKTSQPIVVDATIYASKTTIRYYPTSTWLRVAIYIGIWAVLIALYKILRSELSAKRYES